ncbi:hypothetical protein C7U89_24295 [Bradyrhizobium sp. WBOS4]|nr:hypothetical protein [Bradyrhizobium sp. WBOS8]MDD1586033.1 hypothetical protein [Bradyrhizobium sp. WBOS4]UUO48540.1 hypothetical protein DCM78_17480 [Bradyrhizobium sp. WBOS04]UUO62160.1 hypothetical protein DCM80_25225 [Bradyrhizobium sp. WBOS08]
MGEIVRDAATVLRVVEQGTLLDVHPVTTRRADRWSLETKQCLVCEIGKNWQNFHKTSEHGA